jgi:hypothetical protein
MYNIRTCQISYTYSPSTTPLSDLKPINISELQLETHHVGRVLIVRTFGHSIRFQSVQNAVEDMNLDVDQLAVYNSNPEVAAIHVLLQGAIFAIKEPFYKISSGGGYIIRVDHPSDLLRLKPTYPMVSCELAPKVIEFNENALSYKNVGNVAFKKDYMPALEAYTQGLDACGENDDSLKRDLYRNRSIVNIYLRRFEQAAKDATAAFIPDAGNNEKKAENNTKALYRTGRAFYCQENFLEARSQFEQLL